MDFQADFAALIEDFDGKEFPPPDTIDPDDDDLELDDYGEGEELSEEELAEKLAEHENKRCQPKPYKMKHSDKEIAFVDSETDPFLAGRVPAPFAIGFDMADRYVDFWGDDCVEQFFNFLATLTAEGRQFIIYAHNGGKFDFYYFLKYLDEQKSPLIIGGRLVKIFFAGQEFRDSYAIIPEALGSYKKDEIDYNKFERNVREQHKPEIRAYLRSDCAYLRELVVGFHELFGDKLTIASAGLPMLESYHGFERIGGDGFDQRFRNFYFGGRNQCFETGILRPRNGTWKVYDRNGMYAAEMRNTLHPISNRPELQLKITDKTDFACIDAINNGALPVRAKGGGLDFTQKRGTFFATIHEINAGLETGTLKIERVRYAWAFDLKASFAEFIDAMYEFRNAAKADGDKVRDLLYKRCCNAPYGKFALNPRKFKQWLMTLGEIPEPQASADCPEGWSLHSQSGDIFIWSRPSPRKGGFINVATAASITGASRANLLRNLNLAKRPIYCDTDSIICEQYNGTTGNALGEWKLEAEGELAAIAGKKLYCVYNESDLKESGEAIKKASKGSTITPRDIVAICNGAEIVWKQDAPTFSLDSEPTFIERTIKMTGNL